MKSLTVDEVRDYRARWDAVAAVERRELRATGIDVRFQQLCALFESRALFPADLDSLVRDEEVAQRWARIRRHYGVR